MPADQYKQFASDARAGTFARRKARQDQRAYIRKNWRWLLGGYLALVAVSGTPVLFAGSHFFRGLWLGLVIAGFAGAIVTMVVIQTGTGPTMAGELAEQWTAQELRPLGRHGYRLANHVNVDSRGDADHVLIGPGGLFVLETKWSATPWDGNDRFFGVPLRRVTSRARTTWLQLKSHGISEATAVLVLWGPAAKPLLNATGVRRNGDVFVIAGTHLRRWLLSRAPGALDPAQVDSAFEAVCKIAERADKREAPVPPSMISLLSWAVGATAAWTASLLLSLWTVRLGWLAYAISAGLLLAFGLFLKSRWSRWVGLAITGGAACSLLLMLGAVIYDIFR